MLDHLNHKKIKDKHAKIDETMLTTALEAIGIHGFLNKRIRKITIAEVYDGTNIKSEIIIDEKKYPVKASDELKNMLSIYIDYLKTHNYSVNQNDLLFPLYAKSSSKKKLRRHIGNYSIYRDTNELKKKCREYIDKQLLAVGKNGQQRINEIAEASGKSARAINKSLRTPSQQSEITSKKKVIYRNIIDHALESNDLNFCNNFDKLLRIWDEIVILPELTALDEEKVKKLINIAFAFISSDNYKKIDDDSTGNLSKYFFVQNLRDRVTEIEKTLFENRKKNMKHTVMKKAKSAIQTQPILSSKFQPSDKLIAKEINKLFANIQRVKKEVTPGKWQKWKDYEASRQAASLKKEEDEEDDNIVKKLHDQRNKPLHITVQRDTPLERKRQRINYAKEQVMINTPDHSIVLRNVNDLIKYTGLYCHEVTDLCLKNVVKAEYHIRLLNEKVQTDWIVDEIEPLPVEYPRGCNALSIPLFNEAKEIIRGEIEFLQGVGSPYFYFYINSSLFPLKLSPQPFSRKKPKKGEVPKVPMQIKTSPQQRKINMLVRQLKKMHMLGAGGYERLREDAIRRYCAELIKDGVPIQEVVQSVQRFARYSDEKDANRIISKIQTQETGK